MFFLIKNIYILIYSLYYSILNPSASVMINFYITVIQPQPFSKGMVRQIVKCSSKEGARRSKGRHFIPSADLYPNTCLLPMLLALSRNCHRLDLTLLHQCPPLSHYLSPCSSFVVLEVRDHIMHLLYVYIYRYMHVCMLPSVILF